jgi:hypothetical protein
VGWVTVGALLPFALCASLAAALEWRRGTGALFMGGVVLSTGLPALIIRRSVPLPSVDEQSRFSGRQTLGVARARAMHAMALPLTVLGVALVTAGLVQMIDSA